MPDLQENIEQEQEDNLHKVDGDEESTQPGDDANPDLNERPLSDRETLMNEMGTRRKSQVDESIKTFSTLSGENENTEIVSDLEQEAGDEITIIVDGEEKTVNRSEVMEQGVRTMQKESAADKRLRDATEREKHVTDLEAKFEARQNQFREGLDTDEQISKQAQNFSEAILEDEGEAGKILEQVLKDNRDLKAATADLIDDSKQTRIERNDTKERNRRDMQETFVSDFSDIHDDTHLTNIFNSEAAKYGRDNPDKDFREVFKEAGKVVRDTYMGGEKKAPTTKERKESMARQPKRAGTGKRKLGKLEPKRQTTADIIANMRAGRGQPG